MSDHDHYGEYAVKRHRHYDLEREDETAQEDIRRLREDVRELRNRLYGALGRIASWTAGRPRHGKRSTRQTWRRQTSPNPAMTATKAMAQCPYCIDEPEPEEYDPGPETDDERPVGIPNRCPRRGSRDRADRTPGQRHPRP